METDAATIALLEHQLAEARKLVKRLLQYGHHELHCIPKWQYVESIPRENCDCGYAEARNQAWLFAGRR
jgi:hypothetical protein